MNKKKAILTAAYLTALATCSPAYAQDACFTELPCVEAGTHDAVLIPSWKLEEFEQKKETLRKGAASALAEAQKARELVAGLRAQLDLLLPTYGQLKEENAILERELEKEKAAPGFVGGFITGVVAAAAGLLVLVLAI